MKIAFLPSQHFDITNRKFSRDECIYESLISMGNKVWILKSCKPGYSYIKRKYISLLKRIGYNVRLERSAYVLKRYAEVFEYQLKSLNVDVILSNSSLYTSYLHTSLPLISWTDAIFENIIEFYMSHTGLDPLSKYQGHSAEQKSLRNCTISAFTSQWVANTARQTYSFNNNRIRVVKRGTCLPSIPDKDSLNYNKYNRVGNELRILMIGQDWKRKGYDIALNIVNKINETGLSATLVCIGTEYPGRDKPSYIHLHRKLNKGIPYEWRLFKQLLQTAHVLLLPSKADFTPNVINEAYAFGIPVIASRVGAMPELIDEGETGFLVDKYDDIDAYIDRILKVYGNPDLSNVMMKKAREKHDNELSMSCCASNLNHILKEAIEIH